MGVISARRELAPHRPSPGRPMLPLAAWLSQPPWLASLPWSTAGSLASQAMRQPPMLQAGHPAESAGDGFVTGDSAPHGRAARTAEPDNVLDIWLQRKLRSLFAAIVDEPVPAELLRLIEAAPQTGAADDKDRP